jgi:hypothetical protein
MSETQILLVVLTVTKQLDSWPKRCGKLDFPLLFDILKLTVSYTEFLTAQCLTIITPFKWTNKPASHKLAMVAQRQIFYQLPSSQQHQFQDPITFTSAEVYQKRQTNTPLSLFLSQVANWLKHQFQEPKTPTGYSYYTGTQTNIS